MLTLDATSKIDTAGPPAGEKVAGEGPPGGAASRRNRKLRRSAGGGRAGPAGLGRCDGDQEPRRGLLFLDLESGSGDQEPRRGLLFLDLESGSGEQACAGRPEQRPELGALVRRLGGSGATLSVAREGEGVEGRSTRRGEGKIFVIYWWQKRVISLKFRGEVCNAEGYKLGKLPSRTFWFRGKTELLDLLATGKSGSVWGSF